MTRREFPRKVRTAAIERAAGKCQKCGAALKPGEAEVDHILEDALGGEPVLANAQVLCKQCHKEKTADRVRKIRHADRARDKNNGAIRPKQSIRSAPFQKKERHPKPTLPRRPLYEARDA